MNKQKIRDTLSNLVDIYGDFYVTKNRIRYYIKENLDLLFTCLENGDKVVCNESGVLVVIGYSDNSPRKYIKILSSDLESITSLLQDISTEVTEDLYIKIKKNNPIKLILQKNGFVFHGDRSKEILLVKKYNGAD